MKKSSNNLDHLLPRFVKMFKCDTARISKPLDKYFLILGYNKNTKDDPGQWIDENGKCKDWDYVEEHVIASGYTEAELIASAKHYKSLIGMTWGEFFKEDTKISV